MKSLLLNTYDTLGGAARAAYRIHHAVRHTGVDSKMFVLHKLSSDPTVVPLAGRGGVLTRRYAQRLDNLPLRMYPERPAMVWWSVGWSPSATMTQVKQIDPDLIHLVWVSAGFLPVHALSQWKKPMVWTLEDPWAFTGGCHYPFECEKFCNSCGACPQLKSNNENDLSRRMWRLKDKHYRQLNLTVVGCSRWLADTARKSSLFRNVRVEAIPNPLDTERFRPLDKSFSREALRLPQDRKLILFGAVSVVEERKGFRLLQQAISKLAADGWAEKAELVLFGADQTPAGIANAFKTHSLGSVKDDLILNLLYSAADVMIVPSIQEAFGQTASEAMACGTPVVAFGATGLLDIVEHERTGYLARPFESDDLARGIAWVLEDENRWHTLSVNGRQKVEREFSLAVVGKRYADLYAELAEE